MKSFQAFILSLLLISFSCEEADFSQVCDVSDPATELEWLKEQIENRNDSFQNEISYFTFIFEGRVYIQDVYCGNAFILWSSSYFDCNGKEISFSSEELDQINLIEKELIWEGPACD